MAFRSLTMSQQCADEGKPHITLVKQGSRLREMTVPHYLVPLKFFVEASFHFPFALGTRKIWTYWGSILYYSMHVTHVCGGSCQCIQKPKRKVQRGRGQALSGGTLWQHKRQWTPTETQNVPLNIKNNFFTERGTEHWHRLLLLREVVVSPFLKIFKSLMDTALGN